MKSAVAGLATWVYGNQQISKRTTSVETNSGRPSLGNVEVDARKFGNEYVSDPVTPGLCTKRVQSRQRVGSKEEKGRNR